MTRLVLGIVALLSLSQPAYARSNAAHARSKPRVPGVVNVMGLNSKTCRAFPVNGKCVATSLSSKTMTLGVVLKVHQTTIEDGWAILPKIRSSKTAYGTSGGALALEAASNDLEGAGPTQYVLYNMVGAARLPNKGNFTEVIAPATEGKPAVLRTYVTNTKDPAAWIPLPGDPHIRKGLGGVADWVKGASVAGALALRNLLWDGDPLSQHHLRVLVDPKFKLGRGPLHKLADWVHDHLHL